MSGRCAICPEPATTLVHGIRVCTFHRDHGEDESCTTCGRGPLVQGRRLCYACAGATVTIDVAAMQAVVDELQRGEPLTLQRLARVFGADAIAGLTNPVVAQAHAREDLFRAAAITGVLNRLGGGIVDATDAESIGNSAEAVLVELRKRGVLA